MSSRDEPPEPRETLRERVVRRDGQDPDPYADWQKQALAARDEADRLRQRADYDGARTAANRFVALALGGAGLVSDWTAAGYTLVAGIEQDRRNLPAARESWEAALNILRTLHGDEHPQCAEVMLRLARAYAPGDEQAESLLLRALEIRKKALGEDDPEIGLTVKELAEHYLARRDYARALPHLELAAEFCRKVLGEESWQYATTLVQLGQIHLSRRNFTAAEPLYLRALAILQAAGTDQEVNASVCLNNLGMLYHIRGDDERAEPLLRQVIDMRQRALGERHPLYLHSLQDLAEFYRSRNDLGQAEAWQRQADELEKKIQAGPAGN
jgi:tetratricopeptide (TPR) repeat protein